MKPLHFDLYSKLRSLCFLQKIVSRKISCPGWKIILLAALTQICHAQPPTTFVSNSYHVGRGPGYITTADINNDGKVDIVCMNAADNSLTLLTNNGSGIFVSNATVYVGRFPQYVVTADMNNDGSVDLVSANFVDGTLTILTNNGFGMFGSNATLVASIGATCVRAVSINTNNGSSLDLVAANNATLGTLSVFTNNGNGIFSSNATYAVGNQPTCVVAADLNNDGQVDLACVNNRDSTLTVLTNNGSGIFYSNATYNVGSRPNCLVAADINNKGKFDLITANFLDSTLTVLTNDGNGNFGSNATYSVGSNPISVIATDINGDGKIDLISANSSGRSLTILTNNGNGTFVPNFTYQMVDAAYTVAAADVNHDGIEDLITAEYNGAILLVLTQVSVPSPKLTIVMTNSTALNIFWNSLSGQPAINFILETNADLTTTNWGTSSYVVHNTGTFTNYIATVPIPIPGNLFFRLQQQ